MMGGLYSPGDVTQLAHEVLRRGGIVRVPTFGCSMHPLIRAGDMIHVQPVGPTSFGVGDIVVYESGCRMIAHRVVRRWEENGCQLLLTKGDAFDGCDPPVPISRLMGKVMLVERGRERIRLETRLQKLLASWRIIVWRYGSRIEHHLRSTRRRAKRLAALFRRRGSGATRYEDTGKRC